jgi:acetoin utilization deacetylase AcuC-like enzyme
LRYAYADIYTIPLPAGHRFPIEKYRLVRERLIGEGTIHGRQLHAPAPCPRELLEGAHTAEWVARVFEGRLERNEIRRIGFPWSPELVMRSRVSVAGTLWAAEAALVDGCGGNFAGGTHHAYADHGEGFCIFNDVAVAIRALLGGERVERVAVVDLDVHQGNGTANIFRDDARIFTASIHGRNNWPFEKERSRLDIELEDGTGDLAYLEALDRLLDATFRFGPELIFFVAGVDPLATDRLGRLSLSLDGLRERDTIVLGRARQRSIPVAISFGGGYSDAMETIVEAHANTFRIAEALFPG